jgi:ATP-dependent Lhr-like helicase
LRSSTAGDAEELGAALRQRETDTYLALLPVRDRATAVGGGLRRGPRLRDRRDIDARTGIDVGDLDRVIQPVRRAPSRRSCSDSADRCRLAACATACSSRWTTISCCTAGLLLRWSQGWVEPVVLPPSPRHIVAQQLLALALQENTLGRRTWPEWWHGLAPMAADGAEILQYLIDGGFLETDGDLAFIGPEAERRFGRRHFSELMAAFTAAPELIVLAGRDEIGSVGDDVLLADSAGAARGSCSPDAGGW